MLGQKIQTRRVFFSILGQKIQIRLVFGQGIPILWVWLHYVLSFSKVSWRVHIRLVSGQVWMQRSFSSLDFIARNSNSRSSETQFRLFTIWMQEIQIRWVLFKFHDEKSYLLGFRPRNPASLGFLVKFQDKWSRFVLFGQKSQLAWFIFFHGQESKFAGLFTLYSRTRSPGVCMVFFFQGKEFNFYGFIVKFQKEESQLAWQLIQIRWVLVKF